MRSKPTYDMHACRTFAKALLDLRVRLDSEGAAQVVWSLWRMGLALRKASLRGRKED